MEKFEITKERIKILENCVNENMHFMVVSNLKNWFPNAFKEELRLNTWYKNTTKGFDDLLACITKFNGNRFDFYGFDVSDIYQENDYYELSDRNISLRLATPEEVQTALTKEAIKRGFVDGVTFNPVGFTSKFKAIGNVEIKFKSEYNELQIWADSLECKESNYKSIGRGFCVIFKDGIFGNIINEQQPQELTLQQIADKFEIPTEQLRIKK